MLRPPRRRRHSTAPAVPYAPIPTEETVLEEVLVPASEASAVEAPSTWWEWGVGMLDRPVYQISSAVLIALNAAVIGLETDFPEYPGWNAIENGFLLVFTLELIARVVFITPRRFFRLERNPELCWNVFDFLIVSCGILDFLGTLLPHPILRVLRIIRFLRQLYLLAYGFVEATLAIFWVTMLMTCVLYVCGIILVRLYGRVPTDDPDHDFLTTHFGTVPGSMLSLFELMSQPDLVLYQEVLHNRPSLLPFLICFIIFGSFGMIALLTGVISESMFEKNKARIEEAQMEREQKRTKIQIQTRKIFDSMQADETGVVKKEELFKHSARIYRLLEFGGVTLSELELDELFAALDCDASGGIDCLEFEHGIIQLCEDVRPLSIMELHHCIRKCHILVEETTKNIEEKIGDMDSRLENLAQSFQTLSKSSQAADNHPSGEQKSSTHHLDRRLSSTALPSLSLPKLDYGPLVGPGVGVIDLHPSSPASTVCASRGPTPQASSRPTPSPRPPHPPALPPTSELELLEIRSTRSDPERVTSGPAAGLMFEPSQAGPGGEAGLTRSDDPGRSSEDSHQPPLAKPTDEDLACRSSPTLLEFQKSVQDLALQVRAELRQIEAASGRVGRLVALQEVQTAKLETQGPVGFDDFLQAQTGEGFDACKTSSESAGDLAPETTVEGVTTLQG